jgi:hypothetical protein
MQPRLVLISLFWSAGAAGVWAAASAPEGHVEPARAAKLRDLHHHAAQSAARLQDYRVRLRRREVIGDKPNTAELLMLTIRRQPFSVHVKCLPGSPNAGRELLYVSSRPGAAMSVLTGRGDLLCGMRMEVDLRSEIVTGNSRHGIEEAGFAHCIERLGQALERYLAGQPRSGEFEPLGPQIRAESRVPMEVVVQHISARQEPLLPHGGKRYWHFNSDPDAPEWRLPTLLITFDERGREVEYYHYDRLLPQLTLDEHDFDADRLWPR